jgi:ribosomal RNA-processing protein 12
MDNDEEVKSISRKNESWIKEDLDDDNEILDLLSTKVNQNIVSQNPERQTIAPKEKFSISEDGRIIIEDIDSKKKGRKRSRNEDDEDMNQSDENVVEEENMSTKQSLKSYKSGGTGIHRPINKEMGEEYKSVKARGDMKRKGKPDPYAYIPLNRQSLNRRKKSKFSGQFKNILKAAKKGADIGSSNRFKKLRNK